MTFEMKHDVLTQHESSGIKVNDVAPFRLILGSTGIFTVRDSGFHERKPNFIKMSLWGTEIHLTTAHSVTVAG
jgi:hypothetical protein